MSKECTMKRQVLIQSAGRGHVFFSGDSLLKADSYPESTGIVPLYLEPPRAPNNHVTVTTWALKHLFAITNSDYFPLWIPWCFH